MSYTIEGTITQIGETQNFGDKGFSKREFVVTTNEDYPQPLAIECIKDKAALLDGFNAGDEVTVQVNVRGSAWKDRHFVSLSAWAIAKSGVTMPAGQDEHRDQQDLDDSQDDSELPF